ncbi:MAG: DUF3180 domain-containing protein [Nocardioidaceae bacterium]
MAKQPEPPQGTVGLTSFATLAVAFAIGAVLGYGLVVVSEAVNGTAPVVEWSAVVGLVVVAVVVGGLAWTTYRSVHRDRQRIPAQRGVNLLMLAKASSIAGAVVAGGYVGFASHFLDNLDAFLPRERVLRSGCAAAAAVIIVVCGLALERACRVPIDTDE